MTEMFLIAGRVTGAGRCGRRFHERRFHFDWLAQQWRTVKLLQAFEMRCGLLFVMRWHLISLFHACRYVLSMMWLRYCEMFNWILLIHFYAFDHITFFSRRNVEIDEMEWKRNLHNCRFALGWSISIDNGFCRTWSFLICCGDAWAVVRGGDIAIDGGCRWKCDRCNGLWRDDCWCICCICNCCWRSSIMW